jgi:hypothetical protein
MEAASVVGVEVVRQEVLIRDSIRVLIRGSEAMEGDVSVYHHEGVVAAMVLMAVISAMATATTEPMDEGEVGTMLGEEGVAGIMVALIPN